MTKIGYYAEQSGPTLFLYEVKIRAGPFVLADKKPRYLLINGRKCIWSTEPKQVGWESKIFDYQEDRLCKETIFETLSDAKEAIEKIAMKQSTILNNIITARQRDLILLKKNLNNIDWGTLPKDTYISPLTGKTT